MTNNKFGLTGESYIAKKLDALGAKYWWKPSQRNYYGADFLTEYGTVDVKIATPQFKKRISTKSGIVLSNRFWRFNCHHHGKKQTGIDVFIFIVTGYKKAKPLFFVMPSDVCNGLVFNISERQIENGVYNYFLDAWDVFSNKKALDVFAKEWLKATEYKKQKKKIYNVKLLSAIRKAGFKNKDVYEEAGIHYVRFSRIINGIYPATKDEMRILSQILRQPQKKLFK